MGYNGPQYLVGEKLLAACQRKAERLGKHDKAGQLKPYTAYMLGKEANIDKAYAHRILRGQNMPSREMLQKLCVVLGCTPEETTEIFHSARYLSPSEEREVVYAA